MWSYSIDNKKYKINKKIKIKKDKEISLLIVEDIYIIPIKEILIKNGHNAQKTPILETL